jgi:hypothetical protein
LEGCFAFDLLYINRINGFGTNINGTQINAMSKISLKTLFYIKMIVEGSPIVLDYITVSHPNNNLMKVEFYS